jgi:putative FmdB family regulatory protein
MSFLRIYDFLCPKCGLCEEAFVDNDSQKKPTCPRCKQAEMDRLIPAPVWRWANGNRGF